MQVINGYKRIPKTQRHRKVESTNVEKNVYQKKYLSNEKLMYTHTLIPDKIDFNIKGNIMNRVRCL